MATRGGMSHDDVIAYCLTKPGAWQDEPWEGDLVTKVGTKIFAFHGSVGGGERHRRRPQVWIRPR